MASVTVTIFYGKKVMSEGDFHSQRNCRNIGACAPVTVFVGIAISVTLQALMEIMGYYPVFTVLIEIHHYAENITRILITPIFCITYMTMKKYYPVEPVNIHIQPLMHIIQEKNWIITTKKG